jgi:aryl-alcohol dehydrogenase-like predicted oxidoreductase
MGQLNMIQKKMLGNTGISVSQIGLGTVKFGRNQKIYYPDAFTLPSDKEILALLDCAQELGINILDTAPAYGTSEERLGKLLNDRQHWILCTKVGEEFINGESFFDFSAANLRKSIERSLTRLHTDYLDLVLVHSNGEDKKIIDQDVFSTLANLKESGLIRAFGMSTKTIDGGLLAVDQSDVVMVTYNPVHTVEQSVIAHANEKNKGIFIKKGLASGHLQKIADTDPVQTAMQFIFREAGVSSLILGTLNQAHLKYNVQCASQVLRAKHL